MATNGAPVVVITGAGRGIGRVLATTYATAGYRIVVAGRSVDVLDETAELARAEGAEVLVAPADVRNESSCRELVGQVLADYGRLDVLLNNAAVPGVDMAVAEMDLANWDDTISTNLTGPMLLSREALQGAMLPAGSGNIQFFSSAAAKTVLARKAHYAVSKLALIGLAQTMAVELGSHGVRVNTLVIGTVNGELVQSWIARTAAEQGADPAELQAGLVRSAALARLVEPEEVAAVSLWLASDGASAITGQSINVTAGAEKW